MEIIPIFPLQLVAFPNENIPLHIFELRYRRMMEACEIGKPGFGILPIHDRKIAATGTTMVLTEIARRYEDGRLDVVCTGQAAFQVKRFLVERDEEYAHRAEVSLIDTEADEQVGEYLLKEQVLLQYARFHELIKSEQAPAIDMAKGIAFQVGHTSGLSLPEQIELLAIGSEALRLQYLINHFEKIIPTIESIELTREKVRQNGHFRVMPGVDFDFE